MQTSPLITSPVPSPASVKALLNYATAAGLPALEARMLLMHCTGLNRTALITQDNFVPSLAIQKLFLEFVLRRVSGEPMAYLVGEREFFGRVFTVTPAVLIPRPDTETLVEWVLDVLRDQRAPHVLEMGTGSGIIALSVALERPDANVLASDVSAEAIAVAERNAANLDAHNVQFIQSDWYKKIEHGQQFHLIASNPPYIAANDAHLQSGDLRYEPTSALTDHACGLSALRAIVSGAPAHLMCGGWLLLEHGYDQSDAVCQLLESAGFTDVTSRRDLGGHTRCSGGRWKHAGA
jgi:release factor glutamine methyltransferase